MTCFASDIAGPFETNAMDRISQRCSMQKKATGIFVDLERILNLTV